MGPNFSEEALLIARNILSGNNACETLPKAAAANDASYFAAAAEPVLAVRRDEFQQVRKQRDTALKEVEKLRFALESVVQNLSPARSPPGAMFLPNARSLRPLLEKALKRRLPWD